jgi:N-sulfoglucosamine sulfohydrolase
MMRIVLGLILAAMTAAAADLPNILWVSIEDTGPEVTPYGDRHARTPSLDKLAAEGVTFLNAFAHAPVCAVARSGIITGVYPTSIGTHNMRSRMVPPPHIRAFPEYLRAKGYYTTNNSKTDYNFFPPVTAWDESSKTAHWKNRPDKNQPFFAVFNLNSSHESAIRRQMAKREKDPSAKIHDANKMVLPPYYPDTPKVREAWAAYYDVVTITDRTVGELIAELDEAGLRENTLVIFWGDHGVGLARGKRWLYDSGVKVPIIARWPGKVEPGSVRDDFVQFLDFPPTMLAVAGVDKPEYMHGRVILGERTEPAPERLYFARDRMDEKYDMIRAVRDHRHKYIRNFESHKPWVQFMRTPSQGPIYQELGRLKEEGKLDQLTGLFMADTKSLEELYDTVVDPYEMHNLAGDPDYHQTLTTMRVQLTDWMKATNDHGLIPEPETYRRMYPDNRQEVTAVPKVQKSGELVELTPGTTGASIAYTFDSGDAAHWLLYSKPVRVGAGMTLRAKAIRLGFAESAEVTVSP